ncbi:hypothetical protein ES288_A11G242400v1 [Gossypium darwinii]|uniref:Uncharacterized protein n=1 Tax=Gossypium darwinii TaxID=34276 RepID=A0A5D2EPT4_GOSDA|nr:hypothetical protein ES288_A11G242400v1 [Gossypium darwinii]
MCLRSVLLQVKLSMGRFHFHFVSSSSSPFILISKIKIPNSPPPPPIHRSSSAICRPNFPNTHSSLVSTSHLLISNNLLASSSAQLNSLSLASLFVVSKLPTSCSSYCYCALLYLRKPLLLPHTTHSHNTVSFFFFFLKYF